MPCRREAVGRKHQVAKAHPLFEGYALPTIEGKWRMSTVARVIRPQGALPAKKELDIMGTEKGISLDDRLKKLMQELGNAINEALSDSERIAESISEIRKEGYDVFLVLEATIGFNKRSAEDGSDPEDTELAPDLVEETEQSVNWTAQDEKFLRALKITIDE